MELIDQRVSCNLARLLEILARFNPSVNTQNAMVVN